MHWSVDILALTFFLIDYSVGWHHWIRNKFLSILEQNGKTFDQKNMTTIDSYENHNDTHTKAYLSAPGRVKERCERKLDWYDGTSFLYVLCIYRRMIQFWCCVKCNRIARYGLRIVNANVMCDQSLQWLLFISWIDCIISYKPYFCDCCPYCWFFLRMKCATATIKQFLRRMKEKKQQDNTDDQCYFIELRSNFTSNET